ncbi:response regulator [Candidatus Uhrbacteria bacterium]|nr:response regulator [Candidatus Uhrbacteria bacterium]
MPKKVLLIDGDPFWQKFCQIRLRETCGLDVICSSNVVDARLAVAQHAPAVILMEMILPDQDGFSYLEELKKHPEHSKIPVIVISALSHHGHVSHCAKLGATGYFNKNMLNRTDPLIQLVKKFI